MKLYASLILTLFLAFSCASQKEDLHPSGLNIKEIQPDKLTSFAKQNLLHLGQVYELSPFLYTKTIHIQSNIQSSPFPVLILNTRYAENPKKLFSHFLHFEFYWWLAKNQLHTNAAVKELARVYPKAPIIKGQKQSATYVQLMACYLEFSALKFYLGDKEARIVVTQIMKKDKFASWSYYQVLYKDHAIKRVMKKHALVPTILF